MSDGPQVQEPDDGSELDRMQELALEELLGGARPPDVRARVRAAATARGDHAAAGRRPWPLLAAAAVVLGAAAWWFGPWRTPAEPAWAARLVAVVDADPAEVREARHALLDELQQAPDAWPPVVAALVARLADAPPPPLRSRLVRLLSHAPGDAARGLLAAQVGTHAGALDTRLMYRLARLDVPGAEDALLAGPPRGPQGDVWQAVARIARGDASSLPIVTAFLSTPVSMEQDPDLVFGAAVTAYQAREYGAWPLCWRLAEPHIRGVLARDPRAAHDLTLRMYWFYTFLNAQEPVPLGDHERRMRADLRARPRPADLAAEVDTLLKTME